MHPKLYAPLYVASYLKLLNSYVPANNEQCYTHTDTAQQLEASHFILYRQ